MQEIANIAESVIPIEDWVDSPTFATYNDYYMLIEENKVSCLYYIFREEDEKRNTLTLLFDELVYNKEDPEDTYNLENLKREHPKACTLYLIKSLQKKDRALLLYEIAMSNLLQEVEENKEKIQYYRDRNEKVCRNVSRLINQRLEDE